MAIEPEDYLRPRAQQAASSASISIAVLDHVAEKLPGEDGSFDAGVVAQPQRGGGASPEG